MEGGVPDQQQAPPARAIEPLNQALQQQLNLELVKTRALSLIKAISRILEDFDAMARANATPKWYFNTFSKQLFQDFFRRNKQKRVKIFQLHIFISYWLNVRRQDILGQFSMVNLELYNIVREFKEVSKAFVVYPKNVNAANATSMFTLCAFNTIPLSICHSFWKSFLSNPKLNNTNIPYVFPTVPMHLRNHSA